MNTTNTSSDFNENKKNIYYPRYTLLCNLCTKNTFYISLLLIALGNRRLRRFLLDSVFISKPEFSNICPEFSTLLSGHKCEEFGNRSPQLSTEVSDSKEASDSVDDLLEDKGVTVDAVDGFNSRSNDDDEDGIRREIKYFVKDGCGAGVG